MSCSASVLYEGEISKGKSYTSASDHSASSTIPSNFISVKEKNERNDKRNKTTLNNILKKLIIHKNLPKKDLLLKINKVSNELKTYYVNTIAVLTGILNKWELNGKAGIYDEEYQEMGFIYDELNILLKKLEKVINEK